MMSRARRVKKTISKALRIAVWDTNGGADRRSMNCYAGCGRKIFLESFECGHNIAESLGGETVLNNLKPVCSVCNKSMGTSTFAEFRAKSGFVNSYVNSYVNSTHADTETDMELEPTVIDLTIIDKLYPDPVAKFTAKWF